MSDWTFGDWRQDRQIRELQDDLSHVSASLTAARTSTRRLQSELSKVTGSIEQRLTRLTAAFDAFVEISDLRVTLTLFDEHARVRYQARQLFGEHPVPGELSDVDGYWLAPALSAVRATVDGQPATGLLELARSRDARRAALFQVLATALLGQPEGATGSLVAEVLTELEPSPAMYQRAVWLLVADGHLDPAGRELVQRRGVECLARLSDSERREAVTAWRKAIKPERGVALPTELGQATELLAALDGCERLAVLRHWVAAGLDWNGKPADEVDPIAKQTLQLLVDEGSPVELPLLARERELRKVIESNGTTVRKAEPDGWESPVGRLVELLRQDVVDEEHPGRRALAIQISAAHILAAAEQLAEQARRPLGEEVQARTSLGPVTITRTGVQQKSLDRAVLRRLTPDDGTRRRIGYIAAGSGVGLLVLGLLAGLGWLVPALAAFAVAGWQLWRDRTARAEARENEANTRKRLRADAEECVTMYTEACAELVRRRAQIDDDLAELRAMLAAG